MISKLLWFEVNSWWAIQVNEQKTWLMKLSEKYTIVKMRTFYGTHLGSLNIPSLQGFRAILGLLTLTGPPWSRKKQVNKKSTFDTSVEWLTSTAAKNLKVYVFLTYLLNIVIDVVIFRQYRIDISSISYRYCIEVNTEPSLNSKQRV